VRDQIRAVLSFLDKLAQKPHEIGPDDVRQVLATGVSAGALRNAIQIAEAFGIINRIADALGFDVPPASTFAKEAEFLLKRGYKPM
jgi:hypothetical protein